MPDKTPMMRVKFLRLAGGAVAAGMASLAHVPGGSAAMAGEIIDVPDNPLHGAIAVGVYVSPLKNLKQVELYVDGQLLGVDPSVPFAFLWDTTSVRDGTHVLRADAVYNKRRHSASHPVEVNNATGTGDVFPSLTLYPSEVRP